MSSTKPLRVVVGAVGEGDQQVLRGEHAGGADAARVAQVDARVAGVVVEVEDAVAVAVVGVAGRSRAGARRVGAVVSGTGSSPLLSRILKRRSFIAPASFHLIPESSTAIVTSGRPWSSSRRSAAGLGVVDVRAAHPEELDRVLVDLRTVVRVGRRRELEVVAVAGEVVRRLPGVQVEVGEVAGVAAGPRVGKGGERRRRGSRQRRARSARAAIRRRRLLRGLIGRPRRRSAGDARAPQEAPVLGGRRGRAPQRAGRVPAAGRTSVLETACPAPPGRGFVDDHVRRRRDRRSGRSRRSPGSGPALPQSQSSPGCVQLTVTEPPPALRVATRSSGEPGGRPSAP